MKAPIFQSSARSRRFRQTPPQAEQNAEAQTPFFSKQAEKEGSPAPFFQTKLEIGQAGDAYEREADVVAEAVVNEKTGRPTEKTSAIHPVQKLATPAEENMPATNDGRMAEDKKIQEKPVQKADAPEKKEEPPVQKADAPEKKEEPPVQKADTPEKKEEPPVQKADTPEKKEEPPVQKADAPEKKEEPPVQKADAPEKKEEPPVQKKKESSRAAGPSQKNLSSRLEKGRAGGQPMPKSVRAAMERAFLTDFSAVRLHTDGESVELNRDLQAQAFTHGEHIFFNEGKFNPENTDGKRLLAHELTHVVQQHGGSGRVQRKPEPLPPISTPLPKGAKRTKSGEARLTIGGVKVIIKPDQFSDDGSKKRGETTIEQNSFNINAVTKDDVVTKFTGPEQPELTIQTTYFSGADPASNSAYGRGTTDDDKKASHQSLRFHEGNHGLDFLNFLKTHPFPKFLGKKKMAAADFQAAMDSYGEARDAWVEAADDFSKQSTDCAGHSIDAETGSTICNP